jgi:hypothetical protein
MPIPSKMLTADQIEALRRAAKFSMARARQEFGGKVSAAQLELERRGEQWWARRLAEMREQEAKERA